MVQEGLLLYDRGAFRTHNLWGGTKYDPPTKIRGGRLHVPVTLRAVSPDFLSDDAPLENTDGRALVPLGAAPLGPAGVLAGDAVLIHGCTLKSRSASSTAIRRGDIPPSPPNPTPSACRTTTTICFQFVALSSPTATHRLDRVGTQRGPTIA